MELLEKKNKELIKHKEIIDKENQELKNENENLKLQIQYLSQTLNKMNDLLNQNQCNNIPNIQIPNILNINNNGIYSSPIVENNFTSYINSVNSPESLSSSSPLFNDIQLLTSNNSELLSSNSIDYNVNTNSSNMNTLSPQSSVGEPAALTNENSLQRTLFCQRIMYQVLQTIILTKSLTVYLMVTLASIIQTSAYRPSNNNNNYRNLYQRKNYIQPVPISIQNQILNSNLKVMNCRKNNYFKYWNNKYLYWKDKMS